MHGISAFIKEAQESSLTPFPYQDTGGKKNGWYKPGSKPSAHTESACDLILDFPVSRTMRNKLFFKPPSLWYFWYSRLRQIFKNGILKMSLKSKIKNEYHHTIWGIQAQK